MPLGTGDDEGGAFVHRLAQAALLLALATLGPALWAVSVLPPLATDALIYHLALPALWLERGFFAAADLPFHDQAVEHAPHLFEWIAYALGRLTGDTSLAFLIQPAFLLLLAWAFHRTIRRLGTDRTTALLLTGLLLAFRPFLLNARTTNNDLLPAAGMMLALLGLARLSLRGARGVVTLAGGLAVLLAGKHLGIVYALAALACAAVILPTGPKRRMNPAGTPGAAGALPRRATARWILAGGLLLAGAGFHLHNLAVYGNPVWPGRVSLFGAAIFPGLYDPGAFPTEIPPGAGNALRQILLSGAASALDAPWTILLPLGWLGALVSGAAGLRTARGRRRFAVAALAPPAAFGLYLLLATDWPYWHEPRFFFPLYSALWVAAGSAAGRLVRVLPARRHVRLAQGLLLAMLLALLAETLVLFFRQLPLAWTALVLVAVALGLRRWPRRACRRIGLPALLALALLGAFASPLWWPGFSEARREAWRSQYPRHYGEQGAAWAELAEAAAAGQRFTVAYAGTNLLRPLFGPGLSHRPVYIPVRPGDRPAPPTPETIRKTPTLYAALARARRGRIDGAFWLAGLLRAEADLLVLLDRPFHGGVREELSVVRRHPEIFRPLATGGEVRLFRIDLARLRRLPAPPGGAAEPRPARAAP
jgi:hypothetical protein